MFEERVTHLIELARLEKSSEDRNSFISRLKDARAHAVRMERVESPDPSINPDCICPPEKMLFTCPVHGI